MSDSTSPAVPAQDELNSRIDAFAKAIGCEIDLVKTALALVIDLDHPQALSMFDDEECLTFGDLAKHFVQPGHCKLAVLRFAMKHLRGQTNLKKTNGGANTNDKLAEAIEGMAKANRPIEDWSDRELLERYDEESPKIWKELSERAHGRHCIVYLDSSESEVDVKTSLELLKLARKQSTPEKWRVNGKLRMVKRPGTFLVRLLDESPFCPRVALVNEYCPISDTNWIGICKRTRIITRLHVHDVENAALSKREMKAICKDALKLNTLEFEEEYSEAALLYEELEKQDKLPKLKISSNDVYKTSYSGKRDTGF